MSCGICCTGALFGFAPLGDDEVATLPAPLAAIEHVHKKKRLAFVLPCAAFSGCCSVYENRPRVCRSYSCELVRGVDAGRTSIATAHAIVARVRERCAAVEHSTGRPFHDARRELTENPAANVDAFLTVLAVERDLSKYFRRHTNSDAEPGTTAPPTAEAGARSEASDAAPSKIEPVPPRA